MKTKFALSLLFLGAFVSFAHAQTTVNITASDDTAAETWAGQSPNPANIRVTRTGSTAAALAVWVKVGGTAVRNSDYSFGTTIGAIVTIPAGSAHIDIPVNVLDDSLAEVAETIRIDLEDETSNDTPVPYAIGGDDRAEVDLLDNESSPTPAFVSVAALTPAAEGTGGAPVAGAFRFTRSGNTTAAVAVSYAVSGSAIATTDYTALSGSILIPAGQTVADVVVTPVNDAVLEGDETVALTILPATCSGAHPPSADCYAFGATKTAQLTIADNEVPPVRAVVEVAALNDAAEGGAGNPVSGAFRITRSANLDVALTVAYLIDGSATPDVDYAALSGSIAIPAGVASVDFAVTPVDDAALETSESVTLTILPADCSGLFPPAECYLVGVSASASVMILDDEIAPVIAVSTWQNTNVVGLPASGFGFFTGFATNGHIVSYQVQVDGALRFSGDTDYATPPAPGTPFEFNFVITSLTAGNHTVQAIITDDLGNSVSGTSELFITPVQPPPPTIQILAVDSEAAETLPGETPNPARFRFVITGFPDLAFSYYSFVGTAREEVDFAISYESGVFSTNGITNMWSQDIVITPVDDQISEGTENVKMQLCFVIIAWVYGVGAPIGVECTGDTPGLNAMINLHAHDTISPYPVVRVMASDADAQEVSVLSGNPQNPGAFTITRTAPPTNDLPVHYSLTGTAQPGADYLAITGTTIIPSGVTSATIPVNPLFDALLEGNETVTLTLLPAPTAFSYLLDPGVNNAVTVSIRDYAPTNLPVVRIKVTDSQAIEQPSISPHASFLVERFGGISNALVVPYEITGTASNGLDYVALPDSVSFPGGGRSTSIVIIPYLDAETEADETVVITLRRPVEDVFPPLYLLVGTGPMIGSAGATIREDAPPTGPIDRFERARRLRFPSRYRVVPLPTLPVVAPATNSPAAIVWAVEASGNLTTWEELGQTEDPEEFVDINATEAPRFYRFRQVLPAAP